MAVIGSIDATFLAEGISANGRLYTAEIIEAAVKDMQSRLVDEGALPITMLSHHDARDDSKELVGRVVQVAYHPEHRSATLEGYLIDTRAGRDIASAVEPGPDGRRVLDAVSIRGYWLGPVRTVEFDGRSAECGDALIIEGVDFTKTPGVAAARIHTSSRLTTETDARTPITESVEVNLMSDRPVVYSTTTPSPTDVPPKTGSPAAEAKQNPLADLVTQLREARLSVSGWQGPVDVDLSAWGIDNDDVAPAMTQLGAAFTAALRVLDPDDDDDFDLPGDVDVRTCAGCQGVCPDGAKFCPTCGDALPDEDEADAEEAAPAADTAKETQMSDPTVDTLAEEAAAAARRLLGLPAETAAPATEAAPAPVETEAPKAQETEAPAAVEAPAPEAPKAQETDTPAPAAGAVTLSAEQFAQLMAAISPKQAEAPVESAPAAATPATEAAPAAEAAPKTDALEAINTAIAQAVESAVSGLRQDIVKSYGVPSRAGLVEAAKREAPADLHKLTPSELNSAAAGIWDAVLGTPGE